MTSIASAQVTIGVGERPNKGALLDLKEHAPGPDKTTSNKGLLLPRVNLTNLKPTNPTGANSLPLSIGSLASESWDLEAHIGLVVYNINKCAGGDQIPVGSYVWSGTEWQYLGIDDSGTMALGVIKHPAKENPSYVAGIDPAYMANIYEEFYSADFGTAGRWMTTNLTAYKYDDNIKHSTDPGGTATSGSGTPRTLDGPNANPQIGGVPQYNTAYWSYPAPSGDGTDATEHTKNPHLGLLYTWDAATAGKGGADGQGNIYNTSGVTWGNDEGNYPEGTASNEQQRIQGICPKDWHLPSDKEWNELEKHIYEHAEDYSSYTEAERQSFPGGAWDSNWDTAYDWRPSYDPSAQAHGRAMMSPCGLLPYYNPQGRSKTIKQGGFAIQLAGYANGGSANFFGSHGYFWSASSYSSDAAWCRGVYDGASQVGRYYTTRYNLFSVRCKKD
jgi:uncharacterized protein (TIGR02145 family)